MLFASRWTIRRRVHGLSKYDCIGYGNISDEKLDEIIRKSQKTHEIGVGQSLPTSHLNYVGLTIQQRKITETVCRIDPSKSKFIQYFDLLQII